MSYISLRPEASENQRIHSLFGEMPIECFGHRDQRDNAVNIFTNYE
jgi:hypothetical protein